MLRRCGAPYGEPPREETTVQLPLRARFLFGVPRTGPLVGARALLRKGESCIGRGYFAPTRGIIGGCLLLQQKLSNKNQVEEIVV